MCVRTELIILEWNSVMKACLQWGMGIYIAWNLHMYVDAKPVEPHEPYDSADDVIKIE